MLPGILLLDRGRKKAVLGIVVDHGLGQYLVFRIPFGLGQMVFHKGSDLIHIQVNLRNLVQANAGQVV